MHSVETRAAFSITILSSSVVACRAASNPAAGSANMSRRAPRCRACCRRALLPAARRDLAFQSSGWLRIHAPATPARRRALTDRKVAPLLPVIAPAAKVTGAPDLPLRLAHSTRKTAQRDGQIRVPPTGHCLVLAYDKPTSLVAGWLPGLPQDWTRPRARGRCNVVLTPKFERVHHVLFDQQDCNTELSDGSAALGQFFHGPRRKAECRAHR